MRAPKKLTLVLSALAVLTVFSAGFIKSIFSLPWLVFGVVLAIAVVKFLLVAFYFLDVKSAHRFWQIAITGLAFAIAFGLLAVYPF